MIFSFVQGFGWEWHQVWVLWKQIKEYMAKFIHLIHLPTNSGDQVTQLEDPSNIKKEQIIVLLEHWRRPALASDLVWFSHVLQYFTLLPIVQVDSAQTPSSLRTVWAVLVKYEESEDSPSRVWVLVIQVKSE